MTRETIYTFAKWQVKQGELDTVLQLLKEVAAISRKEPGNMLYKVCQSQSDAHTILLFEAYKDQQAVEFHRNSDNFQHLVIGSILPKLESREVMLASELFINL